MADYPINIPALWVPAVVKGIKTQLRLPIPLIHPEGRTLASLMPLPVPYKPGDRLWVREAHALCHAYGQDRSDEVRWGPWGGLPMAVAPTLDRVCYYKAGFDRCDPPRWRPGTSLPRWASRATLIVADVRACRLWDIEVTDILAEGIQHGRHPSGICVYGLDRDTRHWLAMPTAAYACAWVRTHGKSGPASWAANPWVVALTFKVEPHNIDKMVTP